MDMRFNRLNVLLGEDRVTSLSSRHVMIFGLGGVGGFAAEAIARSGVGKITLVDFDAVNETNINRQLCAYQSTIGQSKVSVIAKRLLDINPNLQIIEKNERYTKETSSTFFIDKPDYIVDAIDSVTDKIDLICTAKSHNIPIISAMGAGNKLDATRLRVSDISKTTMCPLAKVMRKELGIRGIKHLKVVFSDEAPVTRERTPGSASWVVGTAGLLLAGEVIMDLAKATD